MKQLPLDFLQQGFLPPFLPANVTGRDETDNTQPSAELSRPPTAHGKRAPVYSRVHVAMRPGAILLAGATGPRARVYSPSNFRRESVHELNTRRLLAREQNSRTLELQNARTRSTNPAPVNGENYGKQLWNKPVELLRFLRLVRTSCFPQGKEYCRQYKR